MIKTQKKLVIASIIVVAIIIAMFTLSSKQGETNANLGDPNKDFLSIRLYNSNGDLITLPETQSIITIGGQTIKDVSFMDYTIITDASTSGIDIKCTLSSVTAGGSAFENTKSCGCIQSGGTWVCTSPTIVANQLTIPAGKKGAWTSNKLALPGTGICQLSPGTYTISATVSCTYFDGSMDQPIPGNPKTGSIGPFTISEIAGTADFSLSFHPGGIPSEYCGDGICQPPLETSANCLVDC
jgi:hypothetical protein